MARSAKNWICVGAVVILLVLLFDYFRPSLQDNFNSPPLLPMPQSLGFGRQKMVASVEYKQSRQFNSDRNDEPRGTQQYRESSYKNKWLYKNHSVQGQGQHNDQPVHKQDQHNRTSQNTAFQSQSDRKISALQQGNEGTFTKQDVTEMLTTLSQTSHPRSSLLVTSSRPPTSSERNRASSKHPVECPVNKTAPYDGLGHIKRLPQAILIGVMKGGTGAIKTFLYENPSMAVRRAEMHFFSEKYSKGLSYYKELMPESNEDQVTFEGSPTYFLSSQAPKRIYAMNPCTKILVTLIDPTDRLISNFAHLLAHDHPALIANGTIIKTFEEFVVRNGALNIHTKGLQTGVYHKSLQHWLAYFPLSQIHVVDGERLKSEPWVELTAIENFLNVPVISHKDKFVYNEERKFYCHKHIGCLVAGKGRPHPNISATQEEMLRSYYKPHNEMLYKLISRDFLWSKKQ